MRVYPVFSLTFKSIDQLIAETPLILRDPTLHIPKRPLLFGPIHIHENVRLQIKVDEIPLLAQPFIMIPDSGCMACS